MEKKCVNNSSEVKRCINLAFNPNGQVNDDFGCNICFNLLYEP